ncbi:cell division protein FtsZ [soil metagenome]
MIHFDLPKEQSSIIKVIGIGGGGSNAVNHMFSQSIDGVNFIICNTDAQAIATSKVPNKIQLGPHLTQGLGAGANPQIGKQATEESLEEIKKILEVNTKMAFITAGMGGGTGTGGAPIVAKICKDLGILTVGIVTTPFAYEGKKRIAQAENGIGLLKEHVDTLLVISNDKLRHQFGNLTMKAAFSKADNVLATAAKCITDVINSTGQINVDFADVCTVMRNGGVAILGSAACDGENRAQQAIEDALNSPLLNDNDIRGAKWILININSAEGEHEFTMDEVETIQNYLLSHAGEDSDVILGLGYDNSLDSKIGITLIATGFEHKNPFDKKSEVLVIEKRSDEKVVMTLISAEEKITSPVASLFDQPQKAAESEIIAVKAEEKDSMEVTLVENNIPVVQPEVDKPSIIHFDLFGSIPENITSDSVNNSENNQAPLVEKNITSGGYLARPAQIYAEKKAEVPKEPEPAKPLFTPVIEQTPLFDMSLVEKANHKEEKPKVFAAPKPELAVNNDYIRDEEEAKKKAVERVSKLRNLSFNINTADPNNEYEAVPAYLRRNTELHNSIADVESFYSNYVVRTDKNNNTDISSLNTFLEGKKPD